VKDQFARRVAALGQFLVNDPADGLTDDTMRHHLFRVLRARAGEEVVLTDGRGRWCFATVGSDDVRPGSIATDAVDADAELYLAPLKGDRSEWAVAKAAELGVTRVVPLLSARVVARWDDEAAAKAVARWQRVADEACAVARRSHYVVVDQPVRVANVPGHVAVCDFEGRGSLRAVTALAVGPEGGWDDGEWPHDRVRIGLGDNVLRGDTAAVAAATLLVCARDGWSRHTPFTQSGQ
jgi:16S rRNA (uracil1498-N3)-methyltransferase